AAAVRAAAGPAVGGPGLSLRRPPAAAPAPGRGGRRDVATVESETFDPIKLARLCPFPAAGGGYRRGGRVLRVLGPPAGGGAAAGARRGRARGGAGGRRAGGGTAGPRRAAGPRHGDAG